jgi:hypothetical protein
MPQKKTGAYSRKKGDPALICKAGAGKKNQKKRRPLLQHFYILFYINRSSQFMAFTITTASQEGILLTRKNLTVPAHLFIALGIVLLLIGVIPLFFYSMLDPVFKMLLPLLAIIGFTGLITGLRYPGAQNKSIPDTIFFDNKNGRIRIRHSFSENQEAFIYYPEVREFYLETFSESKKEMRYIVLLKKVDGGEWDLFHSSSYSAANRFLDILKTKVKLENKPVYAEATRLPLAKLRVSHQPDVLEFTWKKDIRESATTLALIFAILVATFFYVFDFVLTEEPEKYLMLRNLLISTLVLSVVLGTITLYRTAGRLYLLRVDSDAVHYSEKEGGTRICRERSFTFPDLYSIYYKFDSSNPEARLYFVNQDDEEIRKETLGSRSRCEMFSALEFYRKQYSVNFSELTSLEVLAVESYIQDFIWKRSKVEIL